MVEMPQGDEEQSLLPLDKCGTSGSKSMSVSVTQVYIAHLVRKTLMR